MNICTIEWCNNKHYSKWLCNKHYMRLRIHWDPNIFLPKYQTHCNVEWCEKKHNSNWFCRNHSRAYKLYWDPLHTEVLVGYNVQKHYLYSTYKSMKLRCTSKSCKHYDTYWWRWISLCERWSWVDGFLNFIDDMWDRPKWYTLDRIDVNWNYCKENCRWADNFTQSNNKRSNKKVWVYYDKRYNKYTATITHNKKRVYLWYYTNYDDAVNARLNYEHSNNLYIWWIKA